MTLKYDPVFRFDQHTQSHELLGPSAATVAHDLNLAFAKDIDGKMRDALIAMGWVPPTTARVVTAAVSDALEAAVRKGVAVHWEYLARDLLAAHEALTRR